jgi:hypothetical protein
MIELAPSLSREALAIVVVTGSTYLSNSLSTILPLLIQ